MLDKNFQTEFRELDSLLLEWGDMQYHSPVLLAWMVLKFVTRPEESREHTRLLGDRALRADVFGYLRDMLDSPFFSGDRPVSNTCKSIVQVLLSNCVTAFNETSLGDPKTLIAVATKSLSHPRLCLEFWDKGLDKSVGILLASALRRFPLDLTSVLHFLEPLAMAEISARRVFQLLSRIEHYTDDFTHISPHSVDVGREAGSWVITKPLPLYPRESRHPDLAEFVLPVGTEGVVLLSGDDLDSRQIMSWSADYSAWELFGLVTCSILYSPGVGIDLAPSSLVEGVTAIAKLVTQVLRHDWSLEQHLRPITSQYFTLLQKYSTLPHPPCLLLAECLQCVSVMAGNDPQKVWGQLRRTGFLPHINFAPASIEMISVTPGHYGQLMNSWERPRGIYPVSMAMLDLLLSGFPPADCHASGDALACVILVMREMFAGSHSWRYRHSSNRDQIGHKLLQLCHMILSNPQEKTNKGYSVAEFVQHFLLHSAGTHSLLSTLSLSLDTVNSLYSSRLSVSSPVLQVEALKIAFQVIDLLLQNKKDPGVTPLEQALATQSVKRKVDSHSIPTPIHLVAVIASYIHHHDDPHVPAGATKLLSRLSQVAPMSVFACLGSESLSIRDAFVHRLKSHVEDVELKVAILELVTECVSSQPGMMELFLKIEPATDANSAKNSKVAYVLGKESCLHVVMEFIDRAKKTPPPLLQASLLLLRRLWAGRHDAALIALRAQKDFWKNLTYSLLKPTKDEAETDFLTSAHVMFIIALEVYNILKDKMDAMLIDFLNNFASAGCYKLWMKLLRSLPSSAADSALQDQLQAAQAWSTLLCVGASNDQLFRLTNPTLRISLLEDLLAAIMSHLSPPPPPSSHTSAPHSSQPMPSPTGILIAEELSVLCVVLMRKWVDETVQFEDKVIQSFAAILSSCGGLEARVASNILVSVYSCVVQLLSSVRREAGVSEDLLQSAKGKDFLNSKHVLDLIPYFEETFKNHSLYMKMDSKQRPDITAVYVLTELVKSLLSSSSDIALCLEVLRQHSILSVLGALLGEHLHLATDLEFSSAVFGFFITLSSSKHGSEALLMNRISHHINISLANTLSLNLKEWAGTWQLSLHLMSSLLDSLTHQFIGHTLDFVGVYQEKLVLALDIYHVLQDLSSLEETKSVCHFLFQLSLFKQQWRFATPSLHSDLMERLVYLTGSTAAVVSRRSTLKQIVKTLNAAGLLAPEDGPLGRRGRDQGGVVSGREASPRLTLSWMHDEKVEHDDSWVTASPAYTKLQDGLISILTSCLATIRHYCPPLGPMIMEGGVDLVEFAPLFSLSLAPPTIQLTTPPSLATLTTCLSTGVDLLNKLDPPRAGTPSRSPMKSPSFTRSPASLQKRAEYLGFLEQAVVVLLSQATRYLVDPEVQPHDKLQLKKELANELGNFTADLLRNFTRKGAPSPVRTKLSVPSRGHTHSLQDSFSGKGSSLSFSDASEQAIFRVADTFSKQFFR